MPLDEANAGIYSIIGDHSRKNRKVEKVNSINTEHNIEPFAESFPAKRSSIVTMKVKIPSSLTLCLSMKKRRNHCRSRRNRLSLELFCAPFGGNVSSWSLIAPFVRHRNSLIELDRHQLLFAALKCFCSRLRTLL